MCSYKVKFAAPVESNLIKAFHFFDRINMDFEKQLPSVSTNYYLLLS